MNRFVPAGVVLFATCLCPAFTHAWAATGHQTATTSAASQFQAGNAAAMDRMMVAMDVAPTGDVDRDFVAMMVPHHQGAIDMAQLVLRHGKNEQIRRLAQEIIITQQQEIAAMHRAIGSPPPNNAPSPTANAAPHRHQHAPGQP